MSELQNVNCWDSPSPGGGSAHRARQRMRECVAAADKAARLIPRATRGPRQFFPGPVPQDPASRAKAKVAAAASLAGKAGVLNIADYEG